MLTCHGKRFPRASLPISHDGAIVPIQNRSDDFSGTYLQMHVIAMHICLYMYQVRQEKLNHLMSVAL